MKAKYHIMFFTSPSVTSSRHESVRLIAIARLFLWVFAQLFILLNHLYLHLSFDLFAAQFILSLFVIFAILTLYGLKSAKSVSSSFASAQLVFDVLIMTLLFHVTGGAANPFASLLLFPLIISASTMASSFTWVMVFLTLISYGSLFSSEHLIPQSLLPTQTDMSAAQHHHHQAAAPGTDATANASAFSLHIIGMWFNFALSAILISIFVVKMRQELDRQQQEINRQREQLLRDEQLLGIATQAASAAHHMSTPLSTMAILVDDLQADEHSEELAEDLGVLAAQISNCKQVLDDLRHQARLSQLTESVDHFMAQLVNEFKLLRPSVNLLQSIETSCCHANEENGLQISSDPALRMAILNILNNAADASPQQVSLKATCDEQCLKLDIIDCGLADSDNLARIISAAEQPLESSKDQGMGIGLFLSHATINRHHGEIIVGSASQAGTHIHIKLPLKASETK